MILGTAGHVNHGKTSLVRALTSVDLDVLEQERQRGMTIQLGFAPWRLDESRTVSIVDVPGHARFAHTMATGALGIDAVLLAVAADEGVMPQTREHLGACRALGIEAGVVAMTRIDRVSDVSAAKAAIAEGLRGSVLERAEIVAVCAPRGEGVDALETAVRALAPRARGDARAPAMLPIDRVFTLRGVGTVVTGSLLRGTLCVDEHVELLPARITARIRGLHIHGTAVPSAEAGQRVALNLAGVDGGAIAKAGFVAAPSGMCVGRVFDAELCWLRHLPRALRTARSLGFVCGAVRAQARVRADAPIAPGASGPARVILDRDVPLSGGLRFVLRGAGDAEFGAVVGGGRILDASPEARRTAPTRAALCGGPDDQLSALIEEAGRKGLARAQLAARLGCAPLANGPRLFSERVVAEEKRRVLDTLARLEAERPGERAIAISELGLAALEERVLAELGAQRAIEREGSAVRSAGRDLGALHSAARQHREQLVAQITAAGFTGLEERALAAAHEPSALREQLGALEREQRIVRVSGTCFAAELLQRLARDAAAAVLAQATLPVSWTKDYAGVSRKHAMLLWTHLDRLGVTRRQGDARVAGPRAATLARPSRA